MSLEQGWVPNPESRKGDRGLLGWRTDGEKPRAPGGGRSVGSKKRAEPGGDTRAALSGPSKPSLPCPPGSTGVLFLPEMPRIPRPRAAQRPRSAWRSPGEGPGIAAAAGEGRTQEARGARVMENRARRTARRSAAGRVWGW